MDCRLVDDTDRVTEVSDGKGFGLYNDFKRKQLHQIWITSFVVMN